MPVRHPAYFPIERGRQPAQGLVLPQSCYADSSWAVRLVSGAQANVAGGHL